MNLKTLLRDFAARLFAPLQVFSMLVAICLFTIAGPFGTYDALSVFERAVYWGLIVSLAIVIVTAVKMAVVNVFPNLSYWQNGTLVSLVFTVLYSPILAVLGHTMADRDHVHFIPIWLSFLIVFGVAMAIVQIRYLLHPQEVVAKSRLFDRFADKSVKQIYRVTVRDHYVDVFTDRGTETLLMRFSDAIAELDGIRGNQVYRSHWVACDAMVRLDRSSGKYLLVLKDGSRVPVSRSYREKVEARLANGPASESSAVLAR
jgi:hypothetical protein